MRFFKAILVVGFTSLLLTSCGGGGGCASAASCAATSTSNTATTNTSTFVASPATAVSVAIGQGDTIETTAIEIKYKKRFAVTVSDANGRPVVGAKVSAKVIMAGFFKGYLNRDPVTFKVLQYVQVDFCPAEDTNKNDVLDPGEDTNNDGSLTPARAEVVAVIEGTDITNDQGIVYFVAEYYKSAATWIEYELVATASVTGTEGTVSRFARTSYVAGDDEKVSTPFTRSPFGISPGCNNAL
jgi:hypothetical protein